MSAVRLSNSTVKLVTEGGIPPPSLPILRLFLSASITIFLGCLGANEVG